MVTGFRIEGTEEKGKWELQGNATDTDPTYAPYAMTNQELTEVNTVAATRNTEIIDMSSITLLKSGKSVTVRGYFHVNVAAARYDTLYTLGEKTKTTSSEHFYLIALDNQNNSYMLKVNANTIIVEAINGLPTGNYAIVGNLVLD